MICVANSQFNTAFVSDSHLGSPDADAPALLEFLRTVQVKRLVIVGDFIDLRFIAANGVRQTDGLRWSDWLAVLPRFESVHYVLGNHDSSLEDLVGSQWGPVKLVKELVLDEGGKSTLVVHGHQVDALIRQDISGLRVDIACWFYYRLHALGRTLTRLGWLRRGALVRAIKLTSGPWQRYRRSFVHAVSELAASRGADRVICGHIHWPEIVSTGNGVIYANCGDWVEHNTALLLDDADVLQLATAPGKTSLSADRASVAS